MSDKSSTKVRTETQLPPIPEKKSRIFWVGIIIVIAGLVGAGLYFSGKIFGPAPLETVGIYSASGKIISLSPGNNSFVVEIEVPLRYQGGETAYATQQKTVSFGLDTEIFNEHGSIRADVFFSEAKAGDIVYVSSGNFLNDISLSPDIVILNSDRIDTEAGGAPEGEEAEILQDLERSNFYIDENE
ncbi:MAG: hypothetical protein Q8O83_02300 [bacterium]|nr:hypothetical protein [bacterium]